MPFWPTVFLLSPLPALQGAAESLGQHAAGWDGRPFAVSGAWISLGYQSWEMRLTIEAPGEPTEKSAANSRTAKGKELKSLRVKNQVLGEATDAETEAVVAAVDRKVVDAGGRTAVRGAVVPRPAAQHTDLITCIH